MLRQEPFIEDKNISNSLKTNNKNVFKLKLDWYQMSVLLVILHHLLKLIKIKEESYPWMLTLSDGKVFKANYLTHLQEVKERIT